MVGAAFPVQLSGRRQRCLWRQRTQELAGRRVATYSDSPVKFAALGAFRPQALVPVCTQEAASPIVCAPLLNIIYLAPMLPSPFAPPPARHHRTALPALCGASPPSSRTYITFSSTPKRVLLSPLLHKACTPEPRSFPQGRPMVSIITMLEEGQPSTLLVQSNI